MKRTFYLFSSGRLERKDNTLKFTPIKDDEGGEQELPPRYLPVEDIAEIYAFGSLRTNSSLFNFLGQPSKSQKYVRQMLNDMYSPVPEGISGNEDSIIIIEEAKN